MLTGSGWLLLALFTAAEAARGRSLIGGGEQLVFLAILALGLIFEAVWYLRLPRCKLASQPRA